MRVTDSMLYDQGIYNMDQAESQVQTLTSESSTGVAVTSPWDNPAAAGLAVSEAISGTQLGAIAQATTQASTELSTADASLSAVGNALQQAVTLAQEMSSGVYPASELASQTQVVTNLQNEIVGALNAQVGNRYIFGGSIDDAPPFSIDPVTGAVTYSGDGEVRQVEVAPGVFQNASVNVNNAVNGAAGPPSVNIFTALGELSTALAAGTQTGPNSIQASEADLQTALSQVEAARTQEGSDAAAMQTASQLDQTAQTGATTALSNTVDVDEVTVATQLSEAQTVLQAALSASSKSFQLQLSTLQSENI
jgi:flagellar hook-associated protein 3 FlgL